MKTKKALKLLIEKQEREINALKVETSIKNTYTPVLDDNQEGLPTSTDELFLCLQERDDYLSSENKNGIVIVLIECKPIRILIRILCGFNILFSTATNDSIFLRYTKDGIPTKNQLNALIDTAKILIA